MSDNDDIAKLLRALNDDIRPDAKAPAADGYADDADDEGEDEPPRQMPYGKIALALLTAAGIGLAVVVLDGSRSAAPPAPAPGALIPSQNAETLTAPPAAAGGGTGMAGQGMAPSGQSPAYPQNPVYAQAPGYAQPQGLVSRSGAAPEGLIARPGGVAGASPSLPAQQLQTQTVPIPSVAPPSSGMPVAPPMAVAVAPPPASPPSEAPRNAVAAIPPADTAALQAALAPKVPQGPQRPPVLVKPTRTQPEEPATPARSIPDGRYSVQVGTFRDAANADSLLHRLNSHGFRAYTVDWTDQNAQSWRAVRVGGTDSQNEAKHLASELKSKLGINGYIVSAK
ncbi:cell division septation protein DedD [Azospirillum fermentarium]|uniref:SPOR domain-containing protein n=1 Tax=Azospirillum fermentarium TaxID=1233114 RepID=UPI0022266C15|nr:SPOR domain-containing protein [Azospirillum fermentarium]MCW2245492.1 cell division septation protein DedD [Azospirillum fermentarium]